jgi:hypothetical protein
MNQLLFLGAIPAFHSKLFQPSLFFYGKKGASKVALSCQEKIGFAFKRLSIAIGATRFAVFSQFLLNFKIRFRCNPLHLNFY